MAKETKEKLKKPRTKRNTLNWSELDPVENPYQGEVRPGDKVKAYFAGCPIIGEIEEINYNEDEECRSKSNIFKIRVQGGPYNGMKCPVQKNKIIAKI